MMWSGHTVRVALQELRPRSRAAEVHVVGIELDQLLSLSAGRHGDGYGGAGAHRERQQPPVLGNGPLQELDLDLELCLRLDQLLVLALPRAICCFRARTASFVFSSRSHEPRQHAKPLPTWTTFWLKKMSRWLRSRPSASPRACSRPCARFCWSSSFVAQGLLVAEELERACPRRHFGFIARRPRGRRTVWAKPHEHGLERFGSTSLPSYGFTSASSDSSVSV
jgi:hypothetical protein